VQCVLTTDLSQAMHTSWNKLRSRGEEITTPFYSQRRIKLSCPRTNSQMSCVRLKFQIHSHHRQRCTSHLVKMPMPKSAPDDLQAHQSLPASFHPIYEVVLYCPNTFDQLKLTRNHQNHNTSAPTATVVFHAATTLGA